jgi:hypothetical protein
MKFYGGMALAIIALILLLLWLKDNSENTPATAAAPPPAVAVSTAAPAPAANYSTSMATPRGGYAEANTIAHAHPRNQPVGPRSVSSGCQALAPAAQKAKVTVASCREEGGYTVITVWGYEYNFLNEFLDEAMRVGVRDIAPVQKYTQSILQGRQIFKNTLRFNF